MASLGGFDPREHDPDGGRPEPVPPGDYLVMIEESDVVPTKQGNGIRLTFTAKIIDGEFNGRKIWEGLNLENQSATAQKIGQSQLSALCHAVNLLRVVDDSTELHNIPFIAVVGVQPANGTFRAKNEIVQFKSAAGAPAPVAAQLPLEAAASPPADNKAPLGGSRAPWKT